MYRNELLIRLLAESTIEMQYLQISCDGPVIIDLSLSPLHANSTIVSK